MDDRIPTENLAERAGWELIHSETFLKRLMRRQLILSISCAAVFLLALLGLPLLNYFCPEIMARRIGGFTTTWLLLGVFFFPLSWVIAFVFIKRSIAMEAGEVAKVNKIKGTTSDTSFLGKRKDEFMRWGDEEDES